MNRNSTIDVSIIIVNYNSFDLLENCLISLFKHTSGLTFEVIVVDNGSQTKGLQQIKERYPSVQFILNDENLGFGKANNQGLEIAKGNFILYLNNDTLFIENTLKKVFDYSSSLEENVIIGCKLLNEDMSNQISVGKFDTLWYNFSVNFFLYKFFPRSPRFNKYYLNYKEIINPTEVDFVKGAFLFLSRTDAAELSGFDESFYFYGEEVDLCYRFGSQIGKVIFYPMTSIIHLDGGTTRSNLWFKYKNQTKGKIQFYQKHFSGIVKYLAILFHYCGVFIRIPLYLLGGIILFKGELFLKSWYYFRQLFTYPKNEFKK